MSFAAIPLGHMGGGGRALLEGRIDGTTRHDMEEADRPKPWGGSMHTLGGDYRSLKHISEPTRLRRIWDAVFGFKKKMLI